MGVAVKTEARRAYYRVAVVEGGRIIAEGTHAELLATEPRYAEILAQSDAEADAELQGTELPGTGPEPDLDAVVADDVERSRVLDADLGEMQDRD